MKNTVVFFLLSFLPSLVQAEECRPAPDLQQPQYIIGYGSLMETASKERTTPKAGESLPVLVRGFERGWYARGSSLSPVTFLGVKINPDSQMNAVIYRLPILQDLFQTDRREGGYCRSPVASSQIKMLDRSVVPLGQIWIYTVPPSQISSPSPEFPIVQSYVDIVISGCLEIEEVFSLPDFAKQCVETTKGWSTNWINDRLYPRRPFIYQPKAGRIDRVLEQTIPDIVKHRKIE